VLLLVRSTIPIEDKSDAYPLIRSLKIFQTKYVWQAQRQIERWTSEMLATRPHGYHSVRLLCLLTFDIRGRLWPVGRNWHNIECNPNGDQCAHFETRLA